MNRIQERALRIVYKDYISTYVFTAYVEILFLKAAEHKPNHMVLNI